MGRVRESELLDSLAVLKNEMSKSVQAVNQTQSQFNRSFKDNVFDDPDQVCKFNISLVALQFSTSLFLVLLIL